MASYAALPAVMTCMPDSGAIFDSAITRIRTVRSTIAYRHVSTKQSNPWGDFAHFLGPFRSSLALRAVRLSADTASAPRPQKVPRAAALTLSLKAVTPSVQRG
jgi:hypothetical protein